MSCYESKEVRKKAKDYLRVLNDGDETRGNQMKGSVTKTRMFGATRFDMRERDEVTFSLQRCKSRKDT